MTCSFAQLVEHAKRTAVMQGREFTRPDDDWSMTVLVVHPGDERPSVLRLPGWISNDDEAKQALGWALGAAARVTRPVLTALIQSTWMVEKEGYDPELEPRPSEHPERIERLFILVVDAEVEHAHYATIHRRRRRPPVLGEWKSYTDGQAAGRLVDPLRAAMR